ncbi:MAG: hypothetical protein JJLCMIEE_01232 [Acidimicrobiales bacterium]|nr:MAG: YceI family protein [Actinomycetota bacterium]MBV6508172.1 hypothetical protein [Acidimicrobiales bacterium]RIK08172.1 MAG: hypothetical protein DCC48_02015 [Acidobacteriota bacterium]
MWQRFELDPGRSEVRVVAQSSLHPIEATAKSVTGSFVATINKNDEVELPRGREAAGSLRIESSEFHSGNPLLDRETRRRLDTRRHPTIEGVLTGATATAGGYLLRGEVTCMGVTREVRGEVRLEARDGTIALHGSHGFDIRDWGIKPPRLLALKVHPDVEVQLQAVAIEVDG